MTVCFRDRHLASSFNQWWASKAFSAGLNTIKITDLSFNIVFSIKLFGFKTNVYCVPGKVNGSLAK